MFIALTAGILVACGAISARPSSPTTPTCQPSPIQTSKIGFQEIQGSMTSEGELWALLFNVLAP